MIGGENSSDVLKLSDLSLNATSTTTATTSSSVQSDQSRNKKDDFKIFVGGLPQDCTQADLKDYFSAIGDVDNVILKIDHLTGRSRGFGFVTFHDLKTMNDVLSRGEHGHSIKGKKIAVKKAAGKQGKIYVGKFPSSLTNDTLKDFFSQFGNIFEFQRPIDKMTKEPKDFCFVTFDSEDPADVLLKKGTITIEDYNVNIKRVATKDPSAVMCIPPFFYGNMMRGMPPHAAANAFFSPPFATGPWGVGGGGGLPGGGSGGRNTHHHHHNNSNNVHHPPVNPDWIRSYLNWNPYLLRGGGGGAQGHGYGGFPPGPGGGGGANNHNNNNLPPPPRGNGGGGGGKMSSGNMNNMSNSSQSQRNK